MTFGPLSFRDFSVQGVADAQQSLTQLESKGQGTEPAWSSHLSADYALSNGSAGSLEQQPDAGQQLTCDAAAAALPVSSLHFLFPLFTPCSRHGLSGPGQLRWESGGRQELAEEPL